MKIFILLCMIFCHIVDDYYLQGWLASAKQKSWWEQNAPDKMYRLDYIMALLMHSFSWSFMIMLPIIAYTFLSGLQLDIWIIALYIINTALHAYIDDRKANKRTINLIQDQICHLLQIIATLVVVVL